MNIVIAIDSFKGCISSVDSGRLLKQAIEEVYPGDVVSVFPLADGGEGTVDAMTQGLNGRIVKVPVTGPLGTKIESRYGLLPDTNMAVIEMADASGLPLVPPEKRNPLHTTTYGLGELILAAIDAGCRHFIIGTSPMWRRSTRRRPTPAFRIAHSRLPATSPIRSAGRKAAPMSSGRRKGPRGKSSHA